MFYAYLRRAVPTEYFDVFNFFNQPDANGRVALLPMQDLWGWVDYQWGYRGSDFVWQGINQPLLHRTFDPWSKENEGAYLELNRAIYNKDEVLVSLSCKSMTFGGYCWIEA